ncbi:hypothetical protein Pla123a_06120 [Posidoniimonas polymericola]|uniref:Uncharacterized protein n=1 Tax=Posidoniimonas polymericola TaxID=2528002 RepID=A0A5C5ZFB8_9BACT|nr:hypothetical protein [Posidoniimonas polymericola]TWT85805.1 hypothetical protein Pla123a_06120 [Posidoniimonas polymericola]
MPRLLRALPLSLSGLSCLFWFTSWPWIPLMGALWGIEVVPEDFPNCVSARVQAGPIGVGCLSNQRNSTFFVAAGKDEFIGTCAGSAVWSERADGHFCGFSIPPYGFGHQPAGFGMALTPETFCWNCPYWLMATAWLAVHAKIAGGLRARSGDLLILTGFVAVALALIQLRIALVMTLLLNLSTLALLALLVVSAIGVLFLGKHAWWPLLIEGAVSLEE